MDIEKLKNTIIQGDVLSVLKTLPDNFVDMVITSPPYWGLRDYGLPQTIFGGDFNCQHDWNEYVKHPAGGMGSKGANVGANKNDFANMHDHDVVSNFCSKCGAWRGQLGQEPNYHDYIDHLIEIFNECKRIIKDRGSVWVNLGDSYAGSNQGSGTEKISDKQKSNRGTNYMNTLNHKSILSKIDVRSKSLVGIPDRFKIAMIDSGWICRNEIIWCLEENTEIFVKNSDNKFENKEIKNLSNNDYVLSFDKNKNQKWVKIKNVFDTGEKDAYKIITKSGKEIIASENHVFATKTNSFASKSALFMKKPKFKKLKELSVGDKLLSNEFIDNDFFEKGNDNDFVDGFIVGFYLAEGNYIKHHVGKYVDSKFSFCAQKRWGRLENEADKIDGVQFSCGKKDIERGIIDKIKKYSVNIYEYNNNVILASRDKDLLGLICDNVDGEGSYKHHCSKNVFNKSLSFMKGVVDGFSSGDGCEDVKNNRTRIGICDNKRLRNDLMLLSRILNYNFRSTDSIAKLGKREFPKLDITIRKKSNRNIVFGMMTDEIQSIEKIGKRKMYDIEIDEMYPNTKNKRISWYNNLYFLSNGIFTHNCKPNQMPSSVKDRFTVDFEKFYFFTKNKKYYFEQQLEPYVSEENHKLRNRVKEGKYQNTKQFSDGERDFYSNGGRNKRCVWTINTKPLKEAHFAVYPETLIETPIKACCPENGLVLDPFFGSGTTGVVSKKLNRNYLGIELNPEYIEIAKNRINKLI